MKTARLSFAILLALLLSCSSQTQYSHRDDPRFNSGREFGTGKPIKPKTFQFGGHSFILGHSGQASTLGMFNADREILFFTSPDGSFDSVAQVTINADELSDYLVFEKFEDGSTIHSLTSVTTDSFMHEIISEEIE